MYDKALDLFERMPHRPNDVIYTIISNTCAHLANDRAMIIGKKLLNQPSHTIQNNFLQNSLIHMLMRFGDIKQAEDRFQVMKKSLVTYGAMMKGNSIFIISDQV